MSMTQYLEEIKTLDKHQEQEKALALLIHLKIEPQEGETLDDYLSQVASTNSYHDFFELDGSEYRVLTDDEAEDAWNESLDNYIDECILHELPEQYRKYFNKEAWYRGAKMDGRGHSLAYYDGEENDQAVNGTTYYIYRTN